MADEADMTAERTERELPLLLAASRRAEGPKATGFCAWCDEPVPNGQRFCDPDCAHEHEGHLAAQVRKYGRVVT